MVVTLGLGADQLLQPHYYIRVLFIGHFYLVSDLLYLSCKSIPYQHNCFIESYRFLERNIYNWHYQFVQHITLSKTHLCHIFRLSFQWVANS